MGSKVSVFALVCSFAGYEFVDVYDKCCWSFLGCMLWVCCLWCKVVVKIFCLNINEDETMAELKRRTSNVEGN